MASVDRQGSLDLGWNVPEANAHYKALQALQKTVDPGGEIFGETEVVGSLLGRILEQRDFALRNGRLGPSWLMRLDSILRTGSSVDRFEKQPVTIPLTTDFTTPSRKQWAVRIHEFTPEDIEIGHRLFRPGDSSKIHHVRQGERLKLKSFEERIQIKGYEDTGFRVVLSHQDGPDGLPLPELVLELEGGNFMSYILKDPSQALVFKKQIYTPGYNGGNNYIQITTLPGAEPILEVVEMNLSQDPRILAARNKKS